MIKRILSIPFAMFYRVLKHCYFVDEYRRFRKKYQIHPSVKFNGENIYFYEGGQIIIKENTYIGRHTTIQSCTGSKVTIGKNCAISHFVKIYTESPQADQIFDNNNRTLRSGDVKIGDGCWIGTNVFIREGVTLGNNVVVGANSVVTKDLPENSICAGSPAKVIRYKSKKVKKK